MMASEPRPLKSEWDLWNGCIAIWGAECLIWLDRRPVYCDRGNWIACLEASGRLGRDLDSADAWPRYYFDLGRAKLEVEAWLKKRGQWMGEVTP